MCALKNLKKKKDLNLRLRFNLRVKCIGYSSPHSVTELQAVSGAPFYFINTMKCSPDHSIQISSCILALTTELVAHLAPVKFKFDGGASGTIALHKPCTL